MAEKLSKLIEELVDYKIDIKLKEVNLQFFKKEEQALRRAEIAVIKVKQKEVEDKIDEQKISM